MGKGKLPIFEFGIGDDFESYISDASVAAKWVETPATGLSAPTIGVDQFSEGKKSLKLVLNNIFGSTLDYVIARTFTGLLPSTQYNIQCKLRRTSAVGTPVLWSNGEINMATPADNTWGLSGILTASSDASGNLPVRLEIRTVLNTQTVTYWFDDFFLGTRLNAGFPLDPAVAYSIPADGSEWDQAPSGVEDAWIIGHDQFLDGGLRWIPTVTETVLGVNYTGWDGIGGWRAFLEHAKNKNYFRFYPDKDALATYYNMYLVAPTQESPESENGGFRRVQLRMRTKDRTPVTGF